MIDKIVIDADLCIKLGGHKKYTFLYDILPLVADKIYMHTHAHGEVLMPSSAVQQLSKLISENKVVLVNESNLDSKDRAVYDAAYKNLAKATGIPVFATDEKDLQPIIDKQLNTGIDDITCIRIVDIIIKARDGEVDVSRKVAKALWIIAGKNKDIFDTEIWPVKAE